MILIVSGLLLAGATPAVYAKPAGNAATAVDPYAAEPLVIERQDIVYRYNADGTGSRQETLVVRPQTEAAAHGLRILSFGYAGSSEQVEIGYVRVHKSNGVVVPTAASEAQDGASPETIAAPLYSDRRLVRVGVRGLAAGDQLEYQVRKTYLHPAAKDQFWGVESFGQRTVVLQCSMELRVPTAKEVKVSSGPAFPAKVTVEGSDKVYRWSGSQLKPTLAKTAAGDRGALAAGGPDEEGDGARVLSPIAWTTFPSWEELGNWYRELARAGAAVTPDVKTKADAIVYGLATPEERVRALYAYVSREVRSIDVPFEVGDYQPHAAAEVLANQYGDSNDKSNLLVTLLRAEGVPAMTVLARGGEPIDADVPAPGWFHQVITLVRLGGRGEEIWLDTAPEVAPFGMLDVTLRDRQALAVPLEGSATLRRTPAEPPFPSLNQFAATGTLSEEGELSAHVDLHLRGDEELQYREILRSAVPSQWDHVAALYLRTAAIGGRPSDMVADQPEATATALHMAFDLRQANYGEWASFRIVPLEPGLNLPLTSQQTAPAVDIDFGGKRTDTSLSRLTLPVGFSADLPAPVHLSAPFASLDKTWTLEKGTGAEVLVTQRTLKISVDKLPAVEWPAYRRFLDDAKQTEPWVQLTAVRKGASSGGNPPGAGEDQPKAAELVQAAYELIEARRWDEAKQKLDAAKAINPLQPFLWSSYGAIAEAAGHDVEAADDYRRELQRRPEEGTVSRLLAANEARRGDRAGAEATLKAAVGLNGHDELAVEMLADLQASTDLPAAEKTLRAGLGVAPDSDGLKLALGSVLLKERKTDEGARFLVEVANTSTQPDQLNDAAFALGDASLALPVAESASRRSIRILNDASARDAMTTVNQDAGPGLDAALLHSRQLVSAWDTYGWILFREGNFSEAEPWLRAAWSDSYGKEAGQHLAALLQRQGRAGEARSALQPGEQSFAVSHGGKAVTGTATFVLEYSLASAPRAQLTNGDRSLAGFSGELAKLNTHTLIPPGSPAHVLRRGVLRCQGGSGCSFALNAARAVP